MTKENIIKSLELIKSPQAKLKINENEKLYINIKSNGENNINIYGIKYSLDVDTINSILYAIHENYEQFQLMYENQIGEGMLGGEACIVTITSDNEKIEINDTLLPSEYQANLNGFIDLLINEIQKCK